LVLQRLARYLLKETTSLYLLGVAALCLLLSIDFLTVWARFLIEQNASPTTVGKLMLFKLPWFLHLSLPVAVVFAVLLSTGRLAKDSELKAAYALGTAPLAMLVPLVVFGIGISLLTLVNNGFIEPRAEEAYDELVDSFFYARPPNEVQMNVSYQIEEAGVYFAARVRADEENRELAQLTGILVITEDGSTFTAAQGLWNSEARTWTLEDTEVVRPGEEPAKEGSMTLPFDLEAGASETLVRSETLTLNALWTRLRTVMLAGGETRNLLFQFHRRIADALSAAIFVLIAGTLGLRVRGRASGFAWTIVLLVSFWGVWTLAGNLFDTRVLGPVTAAWFTPGLVGIIGLTLAIGRLR
jgi:lipopolysaccharide export system permease protein